MATLPSPINTKEIAVLQEDASFDTIQFEQHLKDHDEWADLIEMVRDANELVRLARALVPTESGAA